jgi:hypothetical protein
MTPTGDFVDAIIRLYQRDVERLLLRQRLAREE